MIWVHTTIILLAVGSWCASICAKSPDAFGMRGTSSASVMMAISMRYVTRQTVKNCLRFRIFGGLLLTVWRGAGLGSDGE